MSSTFDPMVGHVLEGRYEILAKLARGGMATVYRARDSRLQRIVAVKIMRADLGEDDEFVAKFDREARSAALISHPAVVSIFDQGISLGQPYIVMEYVEGETLRRLISREAPLPPLTALDYLDPIASALAAAHEVGIVHRDIKPENVLISTRGQIKVADFGLAREEHSPQMTATGVLVGTASYLPPELVTHARPDARSDIYSTGILFFELLTGRKPHVGENNYQIAYLHVNSDVPAPSAKLRELELPGFIPDYIDALVAYCTTRDHTSRLSDGRELVDKLRIVRQELTDHPGQHNPDLAAELRPAQVDPDAPTQQISPKPEPRPRPLKEVPTRTLHRARRSAIHRETSEPVSPTAETVIVSTPATETTLIRSGRPPRAGRPFPTSPNLAEPAASQRTPLFPHLSISNDPVHRRRRGVILVLAVLLLTVLITVGSWWWASGRYTTSPDLGQVTFEQAVAAIDANDLRAKKVEAYSETVPAGQVISTDPTGGQRVLRGSEVTVTLSRGPERYPVPDLTDKSLDEARSLLEEVHLGVGSVTEAWSPTVVKGNVISTAEQAGTLLPPRTTVDLTVSAGPEPITVENFEGRDADAAVKKLEGLGLHVSVSEEHSPTVPAGRVISQTPNQGEVYRGSTITITRSLGPEMVEVPDVKWKKREDAERIMKNAGLTPRFVEAPFIGNVVGWVTGIEPAAGTSVPKGSEVELRLG
ncbi:MAG: Stk1 family PASTA domain-containing Ser/Thr kinase [Arachnia propionica]|uniref:Stk1 family PASTA domain-containing Ser/Thr kinase n=1 Tax=Arachnia propionica TaxID=1750 RepID=UPI0027040423|nr:Stk1 family PASTA domain-containing Ser/Thr kinase [Arachnia propionica]